MSRGQSPDINTFAAEIAEGGGGIKVQGFSDELTVTKTARLWDTTTGGAVGQVLPQGFLVRVAFSPDGRLLVTESMESSGKAQLWDTATQKPVGKSLSHAGNKVAFSPDSRTLVTRNNLEVQLWDIANGEPVGASLPHWSFDPVPDAILVLLSGNVDEPAAQKRAAQ